MGKNHLEHALLAFHDAHPTVALALNITRRPFSFLGQQPADQDRQTLKRKSIWHDRLMDYAGSPAGRDQFEAQMTKLGAAAGVQFDFSAYIDRQPIESQRLLLWAGRFGKGEEFMTALSSRHFEQGARGESASKRPTLLAAAQEAGLFDAATVTAFLDSDELHDEVCTTRSGGATARCRAEASTPSHSSASPCPRSGCGGGPTQTPTPTLALALALAPAPAPAPTTRP